MKTNYFWFTLILWGSFLPIVLWSTWYISVSAFIFAVTLFLYTKEAVQNGDIV